MNKEQSFNIRKERRIGNCRVNQKRRDFDAPRDDGSVSRALNFKPRRAEISVN